MMTVAIDQRRIRTARPAPSPAARIVRVALLAGLGGVGLLGLSAGAYSMLSGLAGPPPRQPVRMTASAADWPDLKDGVPALATAVKPPRAPEPVAKVAVAEPLPVPAVSPPPRRLPPIETALVLPAERTATLVGVTKTAALVAPLSSQTARARTAATTFAALPPEPAAKPATTPRPKVAAARAPAAPAAGTAPAAAPEPEAEHTEVFGMKVPSLAPAGRKIAESVEALGNAVRNLPSAF